MDKKIEDLTHNELGDALKERKVNIPASKADRVNLLQSLIAEDDRRAALTDEERASEDAAKEEERRAALTDEQRAAEDETKKTPEQLGFAKRAGRTSTAPVAPPATERPYLDSPRPFGIYIKGVLVRFPKGRTPIKDYGVLSQADVLAAVKKDSYVADNGAEVVE